MRKLRTGPILFQLTLVSRCSFSPSRLKAILIAYKPLDTISRSLTIDTVPPVPTSVQLDHLASGFQTVKEPSHTFFLHAVVVEVVWNAILRWIRGRHCRVRL